MEPSLEEFKNIVSTWEFVGAFQQSFDPGLSQTVIENLDILLFINLCVLSPFLKEFICIMFRHIWNSLMIPSFHQNFYSQFRNLKLI